MVFKCRPESGQRELRDSQCFKVEGATLRSIYAPGHTDDHMCFILDEENAMFTGDNVLGHGTAAFEDLSVYMQSLHSMMQLFSGRAYPGHGPVIDDGPGRIFEYVEHRKSREMQVIMILQECASSPRYFEGATADFITEKIYPGATGRLYQAAVNGVLQILIKLQQENKVCHDSSSSMWHLISQILTAA